MERVKGIEPSCLFNRKQHGWQLGVNGRLASGEAFRATFGEILASRKNRVKLRGNACLDQFPFFAAHLRLSWV
jgi:hypothetical protein